MSTSSGIYHHDIRKATSAGFLEDSAVGIHRAPGLMDLSSEEWVEILKVSLRSQLASPAWCLLE